MVSQYKLISQPRAYASPSSQSCHQLAICICLSFIFNAIHGIHLFELSPPHHYCEFNLEVFKLWLKKKILLLFNLSLSLSSIPSHTLPSFFNWQTRLTVSTWCLTGGVPWGVLHGWPSIVDPTIICLAGLLMVWLGHAFPKYPLLSTATSGSRSTMRNAHSHWVHSWPFLMPPPNQGLWSQLCTLLHLASF